MKRHESSQPDAQAHQTITGSVERVTYHNEQNGYTVLRFQIPGHGEPVVVVGNFSAVTPGESLRLTGWWTTHPQYGDQFKAVDYAVTRPATIAGIQKYLGSGLIKGIGPVTARRIVEHFKEETLEVIESEISRLGEVKGVSRKRVEMIQKAWEEQRAIKDVMLFLQSHSVSTHFAVKIYKQYGADAISVVEKTPYRLAAEVYGIGFRTADQIARNLGMPVDAEERLRAGLQHVLMAATEEGHCYLPAGDLIKRSAEALEVEDQAKLEAAHEKMLDDGLLKIEEHDGERAIYLPPLWQSERGVARRLKALIEKGVRVDSNRVGSWLNRFTEKRGIELSEEQGRAIHLAAESRVMILTGGPGTGKCVLGDSLVISSQGVHTIEEHWCRAQQGITDNSRPDSFRRHVVEVVGRDRIAQTSHAYYGGMQDTIHIKTHLGLELGGTSNHRIWAMTEQGPDWVRLDSLTEGQYVAIRRGDNVWGGNHITPELAYVLGVISGDGSLSSDSTLQIANSDISLLERCQEVLTRHSGIEGGISRSRNTYNLRFNGKAFRQRLVEMGLHRCRSESKTIPHVILQSSRDCVVSYLAGLFDTDGYVGCRRSGQVHFEITLKSAELIRQAQVLLLNLGVVSRRAQKEIKYRYKEREEKRTYWRLTAYGQDADLLMTFIPTRKAVNSQSRSCNPNLDVTPLPGKLIRDVFTLPGKHSRREWWAWKREIKGIRRPSRGRLLGLLETVEPANEMWQVNALKEACRECYFWDRIVAMKCSSAPVYDLTVPDEESFIANGFINHNTTTLRAMVELFYAMRKTVALASPTGRAAQRLSEVTGREAKTIHRLLEFDPAAMQFKRNDVWPLEADVVIVDEASMIDVVLANSLIKAVDERSQLILVGDADQLPSVGPGAVLQDLINSGVAPVARLTQVFRQAAESLIVQNAHRINRGEFPRLVKPGGERSDCYFIEAEEPDQVVNLIVNAVSKSLPNRFGYDPLKDIQTLSPMNRGRAGANHLNDVLQAALNPQPLAGPGKAEMNRGNRVFRVGDKVIQRVNNYKLEVFNGDMGMIEAIDLEDQMLAVRFADRIVAYDFADSLELSHGFAVTIHKAQGSEYPAVVIPLHTQHYLMLSRNLLYTALTRAKKTVVMIGATKAIGMAMHNLEAAHRFTGLARELKG